MTNEEIMALQADRKAFFETPAGRAMRMHVSAVMRSEQAEANPSLSERRSRELGDAVRTTEQVLINEIKKLQGGRAMSTSDLWRVESSPDGHNIVDSTGALIAQCMTEDVATYVVGLRNAAQVPVGWQWRLNGKRDGMTSQWFDCTVEWHELHKNLPACDFRPLFALPESQP